MKKVSILMIILMLFSSCMLTACQNGNTEETITYPTQTIQVVVPYTAGGGCDTFARTVGNYIDINGQSYIVTNIAGSGGSLGVTEVLNSEANGYNLLFHSITALVGCYYSGNFDYKVYKEFIPISFITAMYYGVCVKSDAPYKSLQELIDYAKDNPGELSVGFAGIGGVAHIVGLKFAQAAGIELNFVPYAGASDVKAALEGGHCDIAVLGTSESYDFIEAGKFLQLAYSADERLDSIADTPTFKECGVDVTFTQRNGMLALKGTPQECIDYMESAMKDVAENEEFIEKIEGQAALVEYLDSEESQAWLDELDAMIEPFADQMK